MARVGVARRFGVARRYSAAFAFALLLSVVPIAGTGAQSQPSDAELKKRQEQLEQQQKDLEAQLAEERRIRDEAQAELLAKIGDVDLAQADVNEILEAFDQLKLLVNEQRADLDRAELALAAAEASVEAAIGRVTSLDAQHGELGQRVIDLIVQDLYRARRLGGGFLWLGAHRRHLRRRSPSRADRRCAWGLERNR